MPPKKAPKKKATIAGDFTVAAADLPFVYDDAAPAIYSDGIRMMVSLHGMSLILTQSRMTGTNAMEMKHVGTVYLSPQHAKALALALGARVADYEQALGPINAG